ncbi:50S ribosomal protein L3 [Candidatus Woesebacteria bacterium]|nr:50S ribosomal protein L3 [Candidatus Woesebacteria bacterium]
MLNTILGQKVKMSQAFVGDTRVPVTVLKVGPCVVTQIKRGEKDGYWAVQIGFGTRKIKNITKPVQGHLKKVVSEGIAPRFLREVRMASEPGYKVGDIVSLADIFKLGDIVKVRGVSKGKGFAGVVKRWKFAGGPKTHGQSNRHRSPGSIGQGTTPGRIWKGKKMAGRMGSDTITVQNLRVVNIDQDKNEVAISGPVPGPRGGLITLTKTSEGKIEDLIKTAVEIKKKGKTGEAEKKEASGS